MLSTMSDASYQGVVKGPRTWNMKSQIQDYVWLHDGIEIDHVERDTGFIRESVRFKVVGDEYALERFKQVMKDTVNRGE